MKRLMLSTGLALAIAAGFPGCTTTPKSANTVPLDPGISPDVKGATALFEQGRLSEAMVLCTDLARKDPAMPGLSEIQQKILRKSLEERAAAAIINANNATRIMNVDVDGQKHVPNTYGLRRMVKGEAGSLRQTPTTMQEALQKRVTVHLDGVNLDAFVLAIGASEGINIIADQLDGAKTMTIHAENVPLQEILDYVSRNLGVAFYVGENLIWATPKEDSEPATPMLTRVYRLRKGMSAEELERTDVKINIIQAIDRFVPKMETADLLFDPKAHVLIARNTRQNLAKIEEIIDALDVCPPQVLIEARFISIEGSDMRDLGIDWILNSPIVISKSTVLADGVKATATESQINSTLSEAKPIIGLGGVGTAQGLNLSYQGLLTDPMFKAVIHALESSGKARTLTVPRVTTVNNKEAAIRIGDDFRYFDEFTQQDTTRTEVVNNVPVTYTESYLVPSGPPKLERLGYELIVTPSVGADLNSVTLKLAPQISDVKPESAWVTYALGGSNGTVRIPIFTRSEIVTEIIVRSGETVVMGGLISSAESKRHDKVPFFAEIPLIGRLFRSEKIEETRQNLLIFVTATILSEVGENLVPIVETVAAPAK